MWSKPPLLAWAIGLGSPNNEELFHAKVDEQLKELVSNLIDRWVSNRAEQRGHL
jgi:hypothetical protein